MLDRNFNTSASLLDSKRLGSTIYESIHILASILHKNMDLVNPKRDVSNHPASKLWIGYERELGAYIYAHIEEWCNRGYKTDVNLKNYHIITSGLGRGIYHIPKWISNELIETHRNVIYRKKPDFYPHSWKGEREMCYDWK